MRIDTHTHFYNPTRPQGIPWPPADNELLYRPVLPEHHRALAAACGITGAVVVEASAWLDDNQWILDLAQGDDWIVGFMGHVDPDQNFDIHLARFGDHPLFLGVRFGGGSFAAPDAAVDAAIDVLGQRQLALDVLVHGARQIRGVARAARRQPRLPIIVNHVAHVVIDGGDPDPEWIESMRILAEHAQVFCKVSGFVERSTQQPAPTDPAFYRPTFEVLLEVFGEDRLIFGSNWPVCERSAPLATVVQAVESFTQYHPSLTAKLWWKNGQTAYRFKVDSAYAESAHSESTGGA